MGYNILFIKTVDGEQRVLHVWEVFEIPNCMELDKRLKEVGADFYDISRIPSDPLSGEQF